MALRDQCTCNFLPDYSLSSFGVCGRCFKTFSFQFPKRKVLNTQSRLRTDYSTPLTDIMPRGSIGGVGCSPVPMKLNSSGSDSKNSWHRHITVGGDSVPTIFVPVLPTSSLRNRWFSMPDPLSNYITSTDSFTDNDVKVVSVVPLWGDNMPAILKNNRSNRKPTMLSHPKWYRFKTRLSLCKRPLSFYSPPPQPEHRPFKLISFALSLYIVGYNCENLPKLFLPFLVEIA